MGLLSGLRLVQGRFWVGGRAGLGLVNWFKAGTSCLDAHRTE